MSLRFVRILLLVLLALEIALLIYGPQTRDHAPAIQAALAAKDKPEWWDDAAMGVRYAAWINVGLILLVLATSKWWTRSAGASAEVSRQSSSPASRWFWPALAIAVVACLVVRWPLASKSLWWDESWVVMQVSHGKWRPDTKKPGQFKFLAHDWKRCAFYYQKPTNHVPMSLAQKASFTLTQKLLKDPVGEFRNLAARMPALLASCAAVVLLGLLLRSWGAPLAGVSAALLLALHPWYIRYGVDARAYALIVPLCIGGMFAVSRIWQTRGAKVGPWVAWGLVEFLWLWAYPNAVLDVAALNILLVVVFLRDAEVRMTGLLRLAVTNLFAAMAFIQVFLPNVMQALHWAGSENVAQPLNGYLVKSTLSHLFLGVELGWVKSIETEDLIASTPGVAGTSFWGGMLILSIALAALLWNRSRSSKKLPARFWLVLLTPIISSILFAALVSAAGSYFYQRFVIAALPSVVAVFVLLFAEAFADRSAAPSSGRWARRSLATFLLIMVAVKIAPFWYAQAQVLTSRPYAPLRDVAEFAEKRGSEMGKDGRTKWPPLYVCYGHGHEVMPAYLPEVQSALSRADLEKYIAQAKAENRFLLVMQGHSVHNRALIPDGFTLLDDPAVFTEVKTFIGIEPEFYFRVFELN